jgi:hypothetical protein
MKPSCARLRCAGVIGTLVGGCSARWPGCRDIARVPAGPSSAFVLFWRHTRIIPTRVSMSGVPGERLGDAKAAEREHPRPGRRARPDRRS